MIANTEYGGGGGGWAIAMFSRVVLAQMHRRFFNFFYCGVLGQVHFSRLCFTLKVKIMSKNWKRTIKQWWKKQDCILSERPTRHPPLTAFSVSIVSGR